jgi:c-di-GMP-binding flagellar brake protein YcgR
LTGETHDVSLGGVSVTLEQEIKEGTQVDLALILTQDGIEDPNEEPFETQAGVMWSAPSDSGGWMLGLRFSELTDQHRAHLNRFLTALAYDAQS